MINDNYQAAKEIALWYKSVFWRPLLLGNAKHDWPTQIKAEY